MSTTTTTTGRPICATCGKFASVHHYREVELRQICTGHPIPMAPLAPPPPADPVVTESRLREIIREELWRFHNPNRVYQRDLAAQQSQLAKPGADLSNPSALDAGPHWSTK